MRRRKSDLHARVNRNLPLEFDDVRLTSYAGLELLERYLRTRRFNQLVREAFADLPRWGDFGVVVMVRVFVGLVIGAGRRLRHLAYVADDPIFQRFGNVRVVPTARTLSRWLRHFTMRTVTRFQALNAAVVRQLLPTLGLRTWTVDVDGVVVSTGLQVERAARGYNPHQRKVPSYYPIMAHLAETTHILRVKNRSGNVHDGKAGLPFLAGPVAAAGRAAHGRGPGCGFAWMGRFSARMCCGGCRAAAWAMPSKSRSIAGWICSATSGTVPPGCRWRPA